MVMINDIVVWAARKKIKSYFCCNLVQTIRSCNSIAVSAKRFHVNRHTFPVHRNLRHSHTHHCIGTLIHNISYRIYIDCQYICHVQNRFLGILYLQQKINFYFLFFLFSRLSCHVIITVVSATTRFKNKHKWKWTSSTYGSWYQYQHKTKIGIHLTIHQLGAKVSMCNRCTWNPMENELQNVGR